jgi:hypothetical protein
MIFTSISHNLIRNPSLRSRRTKPAQDCLLHPVSIHRSFNHQAPGYGDAPRAPAKSSLQPAYLQRYYEASRYEDSPIGHKNSALERWDRGRDYLPSHKPDEDTEDNPQPYEAQSDRSRYPERRNGVEYVTAKRALECPGYVRWLFLSGTLSFRCR